MMPFVAEDKLIIAAAKADPDAQPLTPKQLKAMVPNGRQLDAPSPIYQLLPQAGLSHSEERFIMLGMSSTARLPVVCHCERAEGEVIRIISVRKPTRGESAFYQGG